MPHDLTPCTDHPDRPGYSLKNETEADRAITHMMQGIVDALWDGNGEAISLRIAAASSGDSDSFVVESNKVLNLIFKDAAHEPRGKIAP